MIKTDTEHLEKIWKNLNIDENFITSALETDTMVEIDEEEYDPKHFKKEGLKRLKRIIELINNEHSLYRGINPPSDDCEEFARKLSDGIPIRWGDKGGSSGNESSVGVGVCWEKSVSEPKRWGKCIMESTKGYEDVIDLRETLFLDYRYNENELRLDVNKPPNERKLYVDRVCESDVFERYYETFEDEIDGNYKIRVTDESKCYEVKREIRY
jgi:hypothetical protein